MKTTDIEEFINLAKEIDSIAPKEWLPPDEGTLAKSQNIIYTPLVKGTRSYIEKISNQINGSYENGWYDACAVMIRRLLETLIIEVFEQFHLESIIKKNGEFLFLGDLITKILSEQSWTLGRNTRNTLPRLKDVGDKSAHSRRFNAVRQDIDNIKSDLRTVVQELLILAKLK